MTQLSDDLEAKRAINVAYITMAMRKFADGYFKDHITAKYFDQSIYIYAEAQFEAQCLFSVSIDGVVLARKSSKEFIPIMLDSDTVINEVMAKFATHVLNSMADAIKDMAKNNKAKLPTMDTWKEWMR